MFSIRLATIFLTLLAFGCATADDIRVKEPIRTLQANMSPKALTDCVMFKAPAEVTCMAVPYYHFNLTEHPPGTFRILAEVPGQPMGEANFSPNDNGGTTVELRARWNFWGKEAFWDCIKQCASPQNNPGK